MENKQVDAFMRREATALGRAVNNVIDWNRERTGKPPIRVLAVLELSDREKQARTTERAAAIAASGLNETDQKTVRMLIAGMEREYPDANLDVVDRMTHAAIGYVKECSAEKVVKHQTLSFGESHNSAEREWTADRAQGLRALKSLAMAMSAAEKSWYMPSGSIESENTDLWDAVEDRMFDVKHDPAALALAREWGFKQNEFGVLQTDRGTAFSAAELLEHVYREEGIARIKEIER